MISVVCPFYNESAIIEPSVKLMLSNLATLPDDWELIIVNDGSKDNSLELADALAAENEHLRVVSYPQNKGRGYAIRTGVAAAGGDIVVTTEIDSSWGDDIVHRIVEAFAENPTADIIIASPHLEGGGYKNVPMLRVLLSRFGNYIIRFGLSYKVSMNTGMTRGYRRKIFMSLPLYENRKEQHLEIVNKSLALGYSIVEIPAILEWKDHKLIQQPGMKRKSSSNIPHLIRTHLIFSLFAAPFRYLYVIALVLALVAMCFIAAATVALFTPAPSIYLLLTGLFFATLSFITFTLGILGQQNRALVQELWRIQSQLGVPPTGNTHHNDEISQ